MPFAVFRRHQKKLLAVFAILAMFGFVLSDSLYRLTGSGKDRMGNRVVVDLYGRPVYRSELDRMAEQRSIANRFLATFTGSANSFGGYTTRELVDAKILEHEADRLAIPDSPEYAQGYLKRATERSLGLAMNKAIFEQALAPLGPDISGNQVLACLASQIRLENARELLGSPLVTPLDIFQSYRDQTERSTFRLVGIAAADFLDKTGEPTSAEVEALYDQYKDTLPDPLRPTPGFKVPREVKVEALAIDAEEIAKAIEPKLTGAEVRAAYDARKSEFKELNAFPDEIFKDEPGLTPPTYQPFDEVRKGLAHALAEEKAQEQVSETFAKVRTEVIDPFADKYQDAIAENDEAKKAGTRTVPVPEPTSLAAVAKANGLQYQETPMLTYAAAKEVAGLGKSAVGSNPDKPGTVKFADSIFATKSPLFEGLEFAGPNEMRHLLRRVRDVPAHVAPLDEVRSEVVAAWKLDKARFAAEVEARNLAKAVRADGGKFKDTIVGGRPVLATESVSKLRQGVQDPSNPFQNAAPSLAELPQIPQATEALRDALFALKPTEVIVEPDAPKSAFYVITLERRVPAGFEGLYGPGSLAYPFQTQAVQESIRTLGESRIKALRAAAGVKVDWVPPDEKDREDAREAG